LRCKSYNKKTGREKGKTPLSYFLEDRMKVEVETLDNVRKRVEVILPEEKITEIEEKIYEELKKGAKVKGFRPGKIPRSIITHYYKDYIDEELKKRMVQSTMADALSMAKVEPIIEPYVDFLEEEGRHGYKLECEVLPEIELPSYKGVGVEVEAIKVTDEDMEKKIESLRQMHAEMITKEGDIGAQKGDFVVIKYQGYMNGKPVKDIATEAYPLEIGATALMPEFENTLIGMKAGDEREVEIKFPEDYPDKEIASKTILFKLLLKEIREKRLPEVNDEFAKDLNFENMTSLKDGLKKEIEKEKEGARKRDVTQKITESLINGMDIPVPKRLLEKRIEMMVQDAKSRFKTDKLNEEEQRTLESNLKKEFEQRAQERIRIDIVLSKIAEKEGIKVDDNDIHERIKKIAEDTKRPYDDIKSFYEHYNLTENLKSSVVEEKTINFLRDNAIIREKS
jgi:trigger factor